MKRNLRRSERGMTEAEARGLLERGEYGVLSSVSSDGSPYGVPLSYCVVDNAVCFHCAVAGHKLENLAADNRVSFSVVGKTEIQPEQFATAYESVIVTGRAEEVFDSEKQRALEELAAKYSPGLYAEGQRYIELHWDRTRVYRLDIIEISGKRRP